MKNIRIFYLKIFIFGGKFSVYLNRCVFVMASCGACLVVVFGESCRALLLSR